MAGGTAASAANWLAPILVAVTILILARAHYLLHVLKRGNRFSKITTWGTTVFVIGYWTWEWGARSGWWVVASD